MAFSNEHKFTTTTQNPCLMDSDIPSLDGSPTVNLDDTWIPKEFTGATITGTGFLSGSGKITYIPVQTVTTKEVSIDAQGHYEVTFTGSIGGFGQTDHVVKLGGLCGDGQYVYLKSVQIMCGTDNVGNGVTACLVPAPDGKIKSNELKFRTINLDSSSAQQQRTFKVFISVTAEISNTNFGVGKLFPNAK